MAADRDIAGAARTLVDHSATVANRPQHRRIRRAVHSQRPIDETPTAEIVARDVRNWNALLARRTHAAQIFQRVYEQERPDSTQRLLRILEDDGMRRAVLWQNRWVIPFLLKAKDSWDERVLLKYVTRYATKNDTIGFFGPAAWMRLSGEPGTGELRFGPAVTRETLMQFEVWPIAVIAERLAEDGSLRPWLSPRRAALCRVHDHDVFMPPDSPADADAQDIEILRLCDGRHSAREIARRLALGDLARLDRLHRDGLITWTVECPLRTNPESALAALAATIDDPEVRATIESHSTWLDSVTRRLREQMGQSTSLATTLAEVDAEFEERYSQESIQSSGQYYAGRTLTYIDCVRDVALTLNADLMNALMKGVSPVLQSLRWYTYAVVQSLSPAIAGLLPDGQARPLVAIFPQALSLVWSVIQDTAARYRRKWQDLLALDPLQRVVRLEAADLAAAVAKEFAAPHPGWPMARVHNPDILIAAESHDELARGRCTLVLGEVHAGLPSMFQSAVFSLCPDPVNVRDTFYSLVTPPPVINEVSQRLNLGGFFLDAAQLLLPDDPVTHFNARPIADFDVYHGQTGLRVKDVSTRQSWPLPVFFDALLSRATFQIDPFDRPDHSHSPRIVVGDVVVARERWRLTADALGVVNRRRADPGDHPRTFLALRQWARESGVPRYVYAKSSREPKPIFIDLESQKCVELLSHLLKQAAAGDSPGPVMISEMLPEPEGCWLRDSTGDRYTSEVRLLAVDPVPYPPDPES